MTAGSETFDTATFKLKGTERTSDLWTTTAKDCTANTLKAAESFATDGEATLANCKIKCETVGFSTVYNLANKDKTLTYGEKTTFKTALTKTAANILTNSCTGY